MMTYHSEKVEENSLRRHAKRLGLMLHKSRARYWREDNWQEYRICDKHGRVMAGRLYDLAFGDVKDYLDWYEMEMKERREVQPR